MRKSCIWVLALVTACRCSFAAPSAEKIVRTPGTPLAEFARKLLPPQTEFAHPPLEMAFGPANNNVVVVFRTAYDENTNYIGWILVPDKATAGTYVKYVLPAMTEIPGRFDITVNAVFAARIGSNAMRDLIILYKYHRNGSTRDDGFASYVYRWNGKGFEILKEASDKLIGSRTAAEARRKLHNLQ